MTVDMMPVVYEDGSPVAVIHEAFNIIATDEVNAESFIDFDMFFTDKKRKYINNQSEVRLGDGVYKIKTITDKKEHGKPKVTHVYAENIFYDLARGVRKTTAVFDTATAKSAMEYALMGTDWNIGRVAFTTTKSFESDKDNPLAVLQLVAELFYGELIFHPKEKTVDLVRRTGTDNGVVFHFKKNMKSIERRIDTSNLITRLYATGKDGLSFASINGGLSYVEDYSYTDEVLTGSIDCSNFTAAEDVLSYAKLRVADYAKPDYSYDLSVIYLEDTEGYRHEHYGLGDTVRVIDEELSLDIKTRIVRMERDILEPWKTKVELSTTVSTLSLDNDIDIQSAVDAVIKSFVAPRLVQATINTTSGEISAMYELGVVAKYKFTQTDDGILFTHPDGVTCEIKVV